MQYRTLTNALDDKGIPTFADLPEGRVPSFWTHDSGRFWTDIDDAHTRVVTTPHGIFRAKVERDEEPYEPEFEAGDPIHRIPSRVSYPSLGEMVYGNDEDAGVNISHVWDRLYRGHGIHDAVELVDRYLRIFHGGAAKMLTSTVYQSGDYYLAWTTAAQRRAHGWTTTDLEGAVLPESLDGSEWQAYIDGDVYVISVEQLRADDEPEWETVEGPVSGYYGDDHALTSAEEMLVDEIKHVAGNMLPLGGE